MEKKIKHLEFIQEVIGRMSNHSFVLKGWLMTLLIAIFTLTKKEMDSVYVKVSIFSLVVFWLLDAYYLYQERLYRALYDKVRIEDEERIDFSMHVGRLKNGKNTWFRSIFSSTLIIFYPALTLMILLVYLLR